MDQVPSSSFATTGLLPALAPQLQVLRLERVSLETLEFLDVFQSLTPSQSSRDSTSTDTTDPLSPLPLVTDASTWTLYPELTHLAISHCCLPSTSLSPRVASSHSMPVWAHFPSLKSVVLSHNDQSLHLDFWMGLSYATQLQKLNISHNRYKTLRRRSRPTDDDILQNDFPRPTLLELGQINCHVGNIVELNASYCDLMHTEGLDRLYSLERLFLQFNRLSDLASIRGLTCIPQLTLLTLYGNPLAMLANQTTTGSKNSSSGRGATRKTRVRSPSKAYRLAVLDLFWQATSGGQLPVLDHHPATPDEVVKLQNMSYPNTTTTIAPPKPNAKYGEDTALQRRRKVANIMASIAKQKHKQSSSCHSGIMEESGGTPALKFDVLEVMQSVPVLMERPPSPTSLPLLVDEGHVINEGGDKIQIVAANEINEHDNPADREEEKLEFEKFDTDAREIGACVERQPYSEVEDRESDQTSSFHDASKEATPEGETPSPIDGDEAPTEGTHAYPKSAEEVLGNLPISPVRGEQASDDQDQKLDSASRKVLFSNKGPFNSDLDISQISAMSAESREISEGSIVESSALHSAMMLSFATGTNGGRQRAGEDNISAQGSVATPTEDRNKYILAEQKSTFLGPPIYKQISILDNLEIYFQLFVFSTSVEASVTNPLFASVDSEEAACQKILESYPRIRLWPTDRTVQEQQASNNLDPRGLVPQEEYRRVWRERIMGCGRPALKRITPTWTPRLGFHGELIWPVASTSSSRKGSAPYAGKGRPEGVVVEKETILCCSNIAFYVILDHSTRPPKKKGTKPSRTLFPNPIPADSCFAEAVWPHALARHPWTHLQKISIGFGFQRLTLRFRDNGGDSIRPAEEFCYILLTSSKLETVHLLKELQNLTDGIAVAIDTPNSFDHQNPTSGNSVVIENDDPLVLDGLAGSVGNSLGAVLHFQILHQYWKKNDRGSVRRLCVVTDAMIYLFDEDYFADGSCVEDAALSKRAAWGNPVYRIVDKADLTQIISVEAGSSDPCTLTISIRPSSRIYRTHNWRLICRGRDGAERLIEDVRKAMAMASM